MKRTDIIKIVILGIVQVIAVILFAVWAAKNLF
jgi:hypothetical protein